MSEGKTKNSGETGERQRETRSKSSGTVILKADLHCDGCGSKVLKSIRSIDGVESASIDGGQRITVVGRVNPTDLRRLVDEKTHIKIDLVSPNPSNKNSVKNKTDDKKMKPSLNRSFITRKISGNKKLQQEELPVTTAVMKVNLHCQGCIQKMCRRITKTKGYKDMKIDRQKELVTVIGAMDMNALAEALRKQMKKSVEILPPPKPPQEKDNSVVEKPKKNNAVKSSGGEGKEKGVGGNGEAGKEANRVPKEGPQANLNGSGDHQVYYYQPSTSLQAPQMFSDENPNACSVM